MLDLVAIHTVLPAEVINCSALADYAVTTRYPGVYEPVTVEEYDETIKTAQAVVRWAEQVIGIDS